MFDSRTDLFVWLAFTTLFFVAVIGVIALLGESGWTVILSLAMLAGACWLYPRVAERFAGK